MKLFAAACVGAIGAVLLCAYAIGLEAQQHEREVEARRIVDGLVARRPVGVYRPTASDPIDWSDDRWHA